MEPSTRRRAPFAGGGETVSDTDWETWDAQFEADAQNGRLDAMFERLTGPADDPGLRGEVFDNLLRYHVS